MSFVGLCPDWETWDPVKPVENATEAMQLADDWLGIPQVRAATQALPDCESVLFKPSVCLFPQLETTVSSALLFLHMSSTRRVFLFFFLL